ncbi:MAG: acyl-ACP--UDP-N-acetylglucosamine O-acyltransferase [Gammaproteobacteria bacterium]|nr:acyl-ACP--UDP-N-acetylglucosamine O-acyltransferase [Gammaproteobacteria bacterium]
MIDPLAVVDPQASLAPDVSVGPWSYIGAEVEIAAGCRIGAHTVIKGPTRIGPGNRIYSHCSIGEDPQDKKYVGGSPSELRIGARNVIREFCTINRGTPDGGGQTRIGDRNWIMAYVHIAHDCHVGDDTVFANHATLAGHVSVGDHVNLGGFTGIHQFCRIGAYSFTAIAAVVVKDVPPFVLVSGNTARACGLNRVGLQRHGFDAQTQRELKQGYRILFRDGLRLADAVARLQSLPTTNPRLREFVEFLADSRRGIVRGRARPRGRAGERGQD